MEKNIVPQKVIIGALILIAVYLIGLTIVVLYLAFSGKTQTTTGTGSTADTLTLAQMRSDLDALKQSASEYLTREDFVTDEFISEILAVLPTGGVGPTGIPGAKGDKGDQGAAGTNGLITEIKRYDASTDIGANSSGSANASCGAGYTILAGGCRIQGYAPPKDVALTQSYPAGSTWYCYADNLQAAASINLQGAVFCYK